MKNELIAYDVDLIMNHPHQPRKNYSLENIKRLADSIHKNGLIQPIVLSSAHIPYRLIVGQRRLLAYKYLRDNVDKKKYKSIPAIIQSKDDIRQDTLLALTENLHREDLNIIDKAESFKTLIDCGFATTHNEIAKLLSVSRRMVGKYIAIAELSESAKTLTLQKGYTDSEVLSRLLSISHQKETLEKIIRKKLSRKEALSLISDNGIKVTKPEPKLKNRSTVISGEWGKMKKSLKRISLRIDPAKLNSEEKKVFERLVELLEQAGGEEK